MLADTVLILFISVATALLSEGITYLLVYRTDKFKKLTAEVEKDSKKLEKRKENISDLPRQGGGQKKKMERVEEKLKKS
ncbi:Calcium load-activated calcium channel [Desmophyllum pertusum]|uniref:Calcium load-activated calcium channel n=1 Tax=Desmophyllum pertusum TaxID=174260 RepID=A0A9X0CTY7_9CNID|nr:Calcium load-activated calcium channel [Desmophyllum pertusum]